MIARYLSRGALFVLREPGDPEPAAAAVVTREGADRWELKNLSVRPDRQRRGLGRRMIAFLRERYAGPGRVLEAGTGDSPDTLRFYAACGFDPVRVERDFFPRHYPRPSVEAGRPLRDMVYLRLPLGAEAAEAAPLRILVSPAKQMRADPDGFAPEGLPHFLGDAMVLRSALQALSPRELQTLWRCGDALARENAARLREMDLTRNLTPALFAFVGIQYRYMAPGVFTHDQLRYVRRHLRILSGFYGVLRPFDGVAPYRLEMQARLAAEGCRDLYGFWGGRLAAALEAEGGVVIDLCSREYSRAAAPHLSPAVRRVSCVFGREEGGRVAERGTLCKMARGEMVRWLAERQVTDPEALREFDGLGYRFSPTWSGPDRFVFLQEASRRGEEDDI